MKASWRWIICRETLPDRISPQLRIALRRNASTQPFRCYAHEHPASTGSCSVGLKQGSHLGSCLVTDTKAALAAAGVANELVPMPFNVTLVKLGNETVLFDAGTGGQFQPTAGAMIANMEAAGIKPEQITRGVVSNFHPDHVFGLMSKAPDNTPTFPNAVIYVPGNEFKFWMDESIFTKLPEKQHGLPKRLQAMFPLLKDKLKQYEWDTEVIPGIRSIAAPGHTPGHTTFVVASGNKQLMVMSDTTNMPALFAKHPNWHGAIDADPVLAETTRRRLFDRAVSDKSLVTGYHFPFPAVGTVVSDGAGY